MDPPKESWSPSPAGAVPKTNATRVPDEEWEVQKDTLHKLYIVENRTLNYIMSYMQNDKQFHAKKRQYVFRFKKWGWRKYGNSNVERSNEVSHSSRHREEDEDEVEELGPALQELAQDFWTQRAPTAVTDENPSEESRTCVQSVSSSSHNYRAQATQHRDYFPRPLTLQGKEPETMRAELVPIAPSIGDRVLDQAKFTHNPKDSGQDSLSQASRGTPRARKSTEHDTREDTEEDEESRRQKRTKFDRLNRNFACPFRKRNPQRFNVMHYTSCALNPFANFALLKRHIKNFHHRANDSLSCVRCKKQFSDHAALRHHLVQPESCSVVISGCDENPEDGITEEAERALTVRTKDANVRGWRELWACLFPEDDLDMIPGPDFEPVTESHQLENYLLGRTHDLAQTFCSELHAHGLSIDLSVDIESSLRLALLKAVQDFRREHLQEVPRLLQKEMDVYPSSTSTSTVIAHMDIAKPETLFFGNIAE